MATPSDIISRLGYRKGPQSTKNLTTVLKVFMRRGLLRGSDRWRE
jgi:hypothetical protein